MMSSYRVRRSILKKINPDAFKHPLLARLDAHQERIANDPAIQDIRKDARREQRSTRIVLGLIVAAIVVPSVCWFAWLIWAIY